MQQITPSMQQLYTNVSVKRSTATLITGELCLCMLNSTQPNSKWLRDCPLKRTLPDHSWPVQLCSLRVVFEKLLENGAGQYQNGGQFHFKP
ncbi:putative ATP-dependent RNA helicase spindle-E [Trichinella spiralis]|uniref:ATP-dependent RNA helicase spindle-E n=1 Tax=Trichinella spiralis TaxID=6334 RepID=A0ABR3K345_TRISP